MNVHRRVSTLRVVENGRVSVVEVVHLRRVSSIELRWISKLGLHELLWWVSMIHIVGISNGWVAIRRTSAMINGGVTSSSSWKRAGVTKDAIWSDKWSGAR